MLFSSRYNRYKTTRTRITRISIKESLQGILEPDDPFWVFEPVEKSSHGNTKDGVDDIRRNFRERNQHKTAPM